MRVMVVAIAVVLTIGLAQGFPPEIPNASIQPSIVPEVSSALPGGLEVSRPLTPVEPMPETRLPEDPDNPNNPVKRVEDIQDQKYTPRGPLGPGWDDFEFLLWWPKSQGLPPLVSASRNGSPPVLGNPGTTVLVGGHSLQNQDIAGGRFTLGASINPEETIGLEGVYFFLGSRTLKETVRAQGNTSEALGLPFFNAATGQEDVFLVASPGVSRGSVFISSTTRVQGAEANFVANLADYSSFKLNGIVGYRYLQVNEGIGISVNRTDLGTGTYGPIYDGFDGHNQFNGGQLGLHADLAHNYFFCELTGKVALGVTSEVVQINGASTIYTPVLGGVNSQTLPGGVYAVASNIGRTSQSAFAVVPEGIIKCGIKLADMTRFYVGYNFLYLSDLVRPGDQFDRTLNPVQIPTLNPGGAFSGMNRPIPLFTRSDFWAQGLMIGFETRY